MPSAGAIIPPVITTLRQPVPGRPSNLIDTRTFIELDTESPECRIFFTTDGSRPGPLHSSALARESTFQYKGPFTLKAGKRTLKAIAVSRCGLKESNVVTKTYQVEGVSSDDDDAESVASYRDENDFQPIKSRQGRRASVSGMGKVASRNGLNSTRSPRDAWSNSPQPGYHYELSSARYPPSDDYPSGRKGRQGSSPLPDGPINPINHSGTQINFWGVAPGDVPAWANAGGMGGGKAGWSFDPLRGKARRNYQQNAPEHRSTKAESSRPETADP